MTVLPYGVPPRIVFPIEGENLTGKVQGKKASDIEERSCLAILKLPGWGFRFRVRIGQNGVLQDRFTNLPGELEVDIIASNGRVIQPIMIDGEIAHFFAPWQRIVDEAKTIQINSVLVKKGAMPLVRVPAKKDDLWRLATQRETDRLFRELLLGV